MALYCTSISTQFMANNMFDTNFAERSCEKEEMKCN